MTSLSPFAALKSAPLFSNLSEEELTQMAERASMRGFPNGMLLFEESAECHGLFVVASGKVRIFKTSLNGREQILAVEGPGCTVAELPVFDGGTYPASVIAIEDTEAVFLSREAFRCFCLEHPAVALKLLAQVGARLRKLVSLIEELSFTTVRQRLIALLVRQAREKGYSTARGTAMMLSGSHQEIASELGTVRELVSRNLTRLQAEGHLEVDARNILIRDPKAFAALLEE